MTQKQENPSQNSMEKGGSSHVFSLEERRADPQKNTWGKWAHMSTYALVKTVEDVYGGSFITQEVKVGSYYDHMEPGVKLREKFNRTKRKDGEYSLRRGALRLLAAYCGEELSAALAKDAEAAGSSPDEAAKIAGERMERVVIGKVPEGYDLHHEQSIYLGGANFILENKNATREEMKKLEDTIARPDFNPFLLSGAQVLLAFEGLSNLILLHRESVHSLVHELVDRRIEEIQKSDDPSGTHEKLVPVIGKNPDGSELSTWGEGMRFQGTASGNFFNALEIVREKFETDRRVKPTAAWKPVLPRKLYAALMRSH